MQSIRHSRIQHGVGQGSFHSATIEALVDGSSYRFDYVYDCGGLVGPRPSPAMKRALRRLDVTGRANPGGSPTTGARGVIDALVLSHFDQDHLNGAETLAGRFKVERIYLPYLSPRELALEIARQAHDLTEASVVALHQTATGGDALFGVPVTRIEGAPAPDFERGNPEDGRPAPDSDDGDNGLPRGFPDPQRVPLPMTVGLRWCRCSQSLLRLHLNLVDDDQNSCRYVGCHRLSDGLRFLAVLGRVSGRATGIGTRCLSAGAAAKNMHPRRCIGRPVAGQFGPSGVVLPMGPD